MHYLIYTDGAYTMDGEYGAYAYVILDDRKNEIKRFSSPIYDESSNRAELKAIVAGLAALPDDATSCIVISDSRYAIRACTESWKQSANADILKWHADVMRRLNLERIRYQWVRGHRGNFYNELCDSLCKAEMNKPTPENVLRLWKNVIDEKPNVGEKILVYDESCKQGDAFTMCIYEGDGVVYDMFQETTRPMDDSLRWLRLKRLLCIK